MAEAHIRARRGVMSGQASLIWSFLFSAVGLSYFIHGRKRHAPVALVCGLVLMVYPYFVSSAVLLVIIGTVLLVLPYFVSL
jgi:hypothetical protein